MTPTELVRNRNHRYRIGAHRLPWRCADDNPRGEQNRLAAMEGTSAAFVICAEDMVPSTSGTSGVTSTPGVCRYSRTSRFTPVCREWCSSLNGPVLWSSATCNLHF